MPVNVRVPIRLRVDAAALQEREAWIDDAFREAVSRALSRSREEVIAPRGGYVNIGIHVPNYTWMGAAVGAIDSDLRERIEARLNAALDEVIEDAGLFDFIQAQSDAPEPFGQDIAEVFDRSRWQPLIDLYEIASYEDGAVTVIPVEINASDDEDAEGEVIRRNVWFPINRADAARPLDAERPDDNRLMRAMVSQVRREWGDPADAHWGVIWFQTGGTFGLFFSLPGGEARSMIVTSPTQRVIENGAFVTRGGGFPAEPGSIRVYGRVTSDADAERLAHEIYANGIAAQIRRAAPRNRTNTSESTYEEQLAEKVGRELQQRVAAWRTMANGAAEYIVCELVIGGMSSYVVTSPDIAWSGTIPLFPVTQSEEIVVAGERQQRPEDEDRPSGTPLPGQLPSEEGGGTPGTGTGAGGTAGSGDGDGSGAEGGEAGGTGQGRQRGGIIYTGESGTRTGGALYPSAGGTGEALQCGDGFLGEPSLDDLGQAGDNLHDIIADIAARLQISPCEYAGQFCMMAAEAIANRAMGVSAYAVTEQAGNQGFTRPVEVNTGNLGLLDFVPTVSPALQFMTFLSSVVPRLDFLIRLVSATYSNPEYSRLITGTWQGDGYGYLIQFLSTMNYEMKNAVREIFYTTCRVLMMQLLRASREAILNRQRNFEAYAPIFERLVLTQIQPMSTLRHLHDRLRDKLADSGILSDIGMAAFTTWQTAHHAVSDMFAGYSPLRNSPTDSDDDFVRMGESYGIRDATGTIWTMSQLQQALAIRENVTEMIDPLVKQLTDIPGMLDRFRRNPNAIREELRSLLAEMAQANTDVTNEVISDRLYAFRASRLQEDIASATVPGTSFALQGIHLQAHLLISEFFEGSTSYTLGLDSALKGEAGRQEFITFTIFVGTTLLAVVCAPLAVAVGAAIAVYQRYQASEREDIFRALIDPDLVLTRAEVEAELFAAELGVALAFIPYVGRILRGGTTAVRTVAQEGVRGSARLAAGYVRRGLSLAGARAASAAIRERFTEELERSLRNGLIAAIMREIAEDQLLELFLNKLLIEQTMQQLYREFQDFAPPSSSQDYTGRHLNQLPPGGE